MFIFFTIFIFLVSPNSFSKEISVMTYNVENLFDVIDNPSTSDETYLPFEKKNNLDHVKKCMTVKNPVWVKDCYYLDWDDAQYGLKLSRLSQVIDEAEEKKSIDLLVLQEIENLRVLEDLNRILRKPFPTIVHKESSDKRGIDVAILSRLKLDGEASLHRIQFSSLPKNLKEDSREILFARFDKDGFKMSVFAVHFPAPFHDWKFRRDALKTLNSLEKKLVPPQQLSVAAGDFNIPQDEAKKRSYSKEFWKGSWFVSHQEGCKQCLGSSYWSKGKTWSFLDIILVKIPPKSHAKKWTLLADSIELVQVTDSQKTKEGYPWGWSFEDFKSGGVSDHFPVRLSIHHE